jgi:acylphosphatase
MIRRRLVITGKVQNVFYRAWFTEQAAALGLDGWVRNRADGSVEAVVEGAPEMVETMIERARGGSPASRVENVVATDDAPAETLDGFAERPTR